MNTQEWMKEYLKENRKNPVLLRGVAQIYRATGEECYLDYLKRAEKEVDVTNGSVFSFLYQTTKEQNYLDLVEKVNGTLKEENHTEMLPFYMEYETKYGKKERYNEIIAKLDAEQERVYDRETRALRTDAADAIRLMMVYVDTMSVMSIEIYEMYRKLQDYYKELLKCVRREGSFSKEDAWMLSYTMFKGCNMRILLSEKYEDEAVALQEQELPQADEPETNAGIFLMSYAQRKILEEKNR